MSDLQYNHQISISSWNSHLTSDAVKKTEKQKKILQKICNQNNKHSEQMSANNIWCLLCNFNFSTEDRNIHFSTWFVFECETDTVLTQTQEVWHEKSDQKCMSQNIQQAA